MADSIIKLLGRVLISFKIETLSGLHIGGSDAGIEIGGVDKTVIRNALTNQPYIPGSSLRGKIRSQLEKYGGLPLVKSANVLMHSVKTKDEYDHSPVCQIFGVSGDNTFSASSRLIVRDMMLNEKSRNDLNKSGRTDLPYTEVKTEVSIDRVTSAANPRQMERVPAGVEFGDEKAATFVYSIYDGINSNPRRDIDNLALLVKGMQLLEDDYLGGLGSRGSGRIAFKNISLQLRKNDDYNQIITLGSGRDSKQMDSLAELSADIANIQKQIRENLGLPG